jgi:hypothetical protein
MRFAAIIMNHIFVLFGGIATLIACSSSGRRSNDRTSKNSEEQVAEELLGVVALRHSVAGNVLQRKREIL